MVKHTQNKGDPNLNYSNQSLLKDHDIWCSH